MDTCYHCSEVLPEGESWPCEDNGEPRLFCCPACRAVYQCIRDGGFHQYYARRSDKPARPEQPDDSFLAYDEVLEQLPFVEPLGDGYRAKLLACGMHCSACAWLLETAISRLPGVDEVKANLQQQSVTVRWRQSEPVLSAVMETIQSLGYRPQGWSEHARHSAYQMQKQMLQRRMGVAGILMMQVGMLSLGLYAGEFQGMEPATQSLLRLASLLLATLSMAYCATPFLSSAFKALKNAAVNMDVPVSLALTAAYTYSVYTTVAGDGEVYFDTVTMFVFFLLISRFVEIRSRFRLNAQDGGLLPMLVSRRQASRGGEYRIDHVVSRQLRPGDTVLCKSGETVAADGVLSEGASSFDEAAFSGESEAISKRPGDDVLAGTINIGSPVWYTVSRSAAQSSIAFVERMVDDAAQSKPYYAQLIDRISPWFTSVILLIAAVAGTVWLSIDSSQAFTATIAVLIVSCPCALALATPLALSVAHGSARTAGIVPLSGRFLQRLPAVSDIVFDKTGTLSNGDIKAHTAALQGLSEASALQLAASLELHAHHPIADALVRANTLPVLSVSSAREFAGLGVEATLDGRRYRLGKPDWAQAICQQSALAAEYRQARCVLCSEQGPVAAFDFHEQLRDDAAATLDRLREHGYRLHILSGDKLGRVTHVANALNLVSYQGGLKPADKLDAIKAMQADGGTVLMVGDGINDAPVLASADVSIAMLNAADVSKASADGVLLNAELSSIVKALRLARRTRKIIRQNIGWAIGYNLLSVPAAAFGILPPWAAALGMSLSSLIVLANSGRLSRPMVDAEALQAGASAPASAADVRPSLLEGAR